MKVARWKKWLVGEFTWWRLARSLVEVYVVLGIWAWFAADGLIFQPPAPGYRESPEIERVPVTDHERVAVYGRPREGAAWTILHTHGNAEDLGSVRFTIDDFHQAGYSAFGFDYRGYGLSDGRPGARRAIADGEAVLRYLTEVKGVPVSRILLHGRSVGAAVALELAARHPVGGLMVESAFLTAFRVRTVIPLYPFDKLRNDRAIRRVRCPVLVIHSEDDRTIPVWHGRKLFDLAPEPKRAYWVTGADHNDDLTALNQGEYWRRVQAFVELVQARQACQASVKLAPAYSRAGSEADREPVARP